MDNLARDAMLAKEACMSYGRWKAMQPVAEIEKPPIPEGWRECECCGKLFKPIAAQRFCDIGCRREAYEEKARQMRKECIKRWREEQKEKKHESET